MTEPKPCPFCGHVPKIVPWRNRGYAVICSNHKCPAQPEVAPQHYDDGWSEEKAVAVWNRRFPERETGEWEFVHYDHAVCTNCGGEFPAPFDTTEEACHGWDELPPFCPHCGAEMERKKLLRKWAAIKARQTRERRKAAKDAH